MKLSELPFGEVIRDGEFDWLGLTAEEYEGKKHLTFLASEKFLEELNNNKTVSCVITNNKELSTRLNKNFGIIIVEKPKKVFFELHNELEKKGFYSKENSENKISIKANISNTAIFNGKNIIIEDEVTIDENVVIYSDVHIKKGTRIGAGTVIGSRPFQIVQLEEKVITVTPVGKVIIDESVEILCNTVIVKGVFGDTYIGKRVCIDNLVHIAHDVKIGAGSLIVAGTVLGGRARLGDNSYTGINASVKNGLIIGENAKINMGAVVSKNVDASQTVTGNLAIEHSKFIENLKKIK